MLHPRILKLQREPSSFPGDWHESLYFVPDVCQQNVENPLVISSLCPVVMTLTDIQALLDVSPLHLGLEVVQLVVDLQVPHAAVEPRLDAQEVFDVLYRPGTAHKNRLVESYSGEQALKYLEYFH